LPITAEVAALPGASPRLLGAYLASLTGEEASRPDFLAVAVDPASDSPSQGPVTDPVLDEVLPGPAADVIAAYRLTGRAGEMAQVLATVGGQALSVLLVGVGDRSARSLRRAGGELGRRIADGATVVTSIVADSDAAGVGAFAEGILLGGYRFDRKSGPAAGTGEPGRAQLLVGLDGDWSGILDRAGVTAGAVALARDLANEPSAVKSPQWLADRALEATAGQGVTGRVRDADELAAGGFGGILAVGSGSARPPRLIELSYHPDGAQGHTVLVGKGITFDSGGLSLKPNDGMVAMKTDMAGGAAVIAVLSALARLGVRRRVTGLIAAAENMPSGSSYRPGDVLTQYGGTTVEVLNTDAEGRLVLADAMAYAGAELHPDVMIDIATLTGAARVALGTSHAALYATDDALAGALTAAGEATGDRVWRMPLEDGYAPALASDVADICHIARDGSPGSITAALFLREFAGGQPWAHLDIAGTGRSSENAGELSKGATGFGVRLLLDLLAG
jgi:leucyl aminopeptidase